MPRTTNFETIEYQVAGDSYVSTSKDLSVQRTKNLYPVVAPNCLPTTPIALQSFPGLKLWSSGTAGKSDRGIYKRLFNGKGWKVSGGTLYSFDSNGTQTDEGLITGSDIVSMADNGSSLLIIGGSTAYVHDGAGLSILSLSFTPVNVSYLNQQFLILDSTGKVRISDVGSTTFSATNFFEPESSSDDVVATKVFNQFVINFGTDTIEPWENTGVGTPPFERMNGAIIEDVGLLNKDCVTTTKDAMFFLGSDGIPYRMQSFQATKLTEQNHAVAQAFRSAAKTNAFVRGLIVEGQDVIAYTLPSVKKTFCYSVPTGLWFEVTHDVNDSTWLGKTSSFLFDKTLVGDRTNGNIYELDPDTYQDNSVLKDRERVFRPLSGSAIGSPREMLQMKAIRYGVETGVGITDDDPQMMVSYSTDGGRTYSNERTLELGQDGEYINSIEDYRNYKFVDLTVKIRYTENTRFTLYNASIDIRKAGRAQQR